MLVMFSDGLILNKTLKNVALIAGGIAHKIINSLAIIPSKLIALTIDSIKIGCKIFLNRTFNHTILVGIILNREIIKPKVNKDIPEVEPPIISKLCWTMCGSLICIIAKIIPAKDRVINGVLNIFNAIFL